MYCKRRVHTTLYIEVVVSVYIGRIETREKKKINTIQQKVKVSDENRAKNRNEGWKKKHTLKIHLSQKEKRKQKDFKLNKNKERGKISIRTTKVYRKQKQGSQTKSTDSKNKNKAARIGIKQ